MVGSAAIGDREGSKTEIPVALTNAGQFFARSRLLELAERHWPGGIRRASLLHDKRLHGARPMHAGDEIHLDVGGL